MPLLAYDLASRWLWQRYIWLVVHDSPLRGPITVLWLFRHLGLGSLDLLPSDITKVGIFVIFLEKTSARQICGLQREAYFMQIGLFVVPF